MVYAVRASLHWSIFHPAAHPSDCSPPVVSVNDADNTPASTTAKVTPPTLPNNVPWDNYKLTVCKKGTTTCLNFNCAAATINACPLTGLAPTTLYTVTVVAQRSGYPDSPASNTDEFTTLSLSCPTRASCAFSAP